jgi:myosin heavy subunit
MTDMKMLNEAELSRNLERRFLDSKLNDYMTYVGPTLLVVNPFAGYKRFLNDKIKKAYIQDVFLDFPA